ncbi:pectate lyase superfamily protein-domain-containing protein, partial [Stachybotrys elegans]
MVDNTGNTFGVAPDGGTLEAPEVGYSEEELAMLKSGISYNMTIEERQNSGYWFGDIKHGDMPWAPSGYQLYRNVKDFGAVGDGVTDDTAAINRAASWWSEQMATERCGRWCGQTTTLGAVVYFPTGRYLISSPIVQYYFTAFIGDANQRPTIIGSPDFKGIALIDCDPYIPLGNGDNWYINQNQFFRQIKHMIFNLERMPRENVDGTESYAPTGIHWQVSQAASLQYLDFIMPLSDERGSTTAVGIFMENGSGGFLSDLYFFGGGIGFRAGSQQYTARNLRFVLSLTAISMIWDWGFTWQNIEVEATWVAIECKNIGGLHNQGAGSVTVLDSVFKSVPYPIVLRNGGPSSNLVLDNVRIENSASVVLIDGGETILPGTAGTMTIPTWALGKRYTTLESKGEMITGYIDLPMSKPRDLLDGNGRVFARPKPHYGHIGAGGFVVATDHGVSNFAEGDQSDAINRLLASNVGKPIFFPAGIYYVQKTVFIPVGSIIVGELWSQIMGTGAFFADENDPQVMVRVGNPGDAGIVEISDMMWTVKGPTRGAIMMEWNVHETTQGSAAMWDSHFRVGGAAGSELTLAECPKLTGRVNRNCMAAFLLFHVTAKSSGYFENIWVWTADHDMDVQVAGGTPTTSGSQIDVYTARGMLIESEGPCWFYGTGSEHHQMYQYQIANAKNIFMTHIQTETPYYQPTPDASEPYALGAFRGDPMFGDCDPGSKCLEAWALRVLNSRDVLIYSAGMYSFFWNYDQACLDDETCQQRLVETSYTERLWLFNVFTKGSMEVFTPRGGIPPTLQSDENQFGFTTEISAWLVLAYEGGDIG